MKNIVRFLFLVISLTAFYTTVSAQTTSRQRLTREQLAKVQAKHIAKEMEMDDETSQRFIDTFCGFQREIWALGQRPKQPHRRDGTGVESPFRPQPENIGFAAKVLCHLQRVSDTEADPAGI